MSRRARSAERKQQLIQAAEESIAELGLSALTIREIAARAGMSPGSVLYHYPETEDLVYDVHRTLVDRYVDHRMRELSRTTDSPRRLVKAFASGLPSGPDDHICRPLYELHGLAARSKLHASLMASLWDRELMLYQGIIETGLANEQFSSSKSARVLAASFLAMEDGLGLHIISGNSSVTLAFALDLMIEIASGELGHDLSQYL